MTSCYINIINGWTPNVRTQGCSKLNRKLVFLTQLVNQNLRGKEKKTDLSRATLYFYLTGTSSLDSMYKFSFQQ